MCYTIIPTNDVGLWSRNYRREPCARPIAAFIITTVDTVSRIVLGVKRSDRSRPRSLSPELVGEMNSSRVPVHIRVRTRILTRSVPQRHERAYIHGTIYELLMSLRNDPEPTDSWDTSGDRDTDNPSPTLKTRPRRHADSLLAPFFRLSHPAVDAFD